LIKPIHLVYLATLVKACENTLEKMVMKSIYGWEPSVKHFPVWEAILRVNLP